MNTYVRKNKKTNGQFCLDIKVKYWKDDVKNNKERPDMTNHADKEKIHIF